ncbi:MAG: hypothetical protein JXR96_27700 [Deltaproteobacteria bacterium]|nr:hypothetical protein [Deltaproteobacteria bacterium]
MKWIATRAGTFWWLAILVSASLASGCGREGFVPAVDPCEDVSCSGHGVCAAVEDLARCVCDPGYRAEGADCVEDGQTDACDGFTCSGHGLCVVLDGRPTCACDPGYHAEDVDCVADADPCAGIACSGHGVCGVTSDGSLICACYTGFRNNGPLVCEPDPGSGYCFVDSDCDDGDVCTDDICGAAGDCQHPFNLAPCNDGLFCTSTDVCDGAGHCVGRGDPCAGGDACNSTCNELARHCFSPASAPCDDGLFCTSTDACDGAGHCVGSGDTCAGGDVCNNTCNELAGNCHSPAATPCDDGLFCTLADACNGAGQCVGSGDPCAGGNACNNTCNELAGNCYSPASTPCDDHLFCTLADACNGAGQCVGSGDPCAGGDTCNDTCNELARSCYSPASTPCDDHLFCTAMDACNGAGLCVGSGDPCAGGDACNDTCNESAGNCYAPSLTPCASDGRICSLDYCDGAGGCVHPAGNAGVECRASAGDCDPAELCDGVNTTCPVNALEPGTVLCRGSAGACDPAEHCDGVSPTCPPNALEPDTTVCRPSTDADCDPAEHCDGVSADCPSDLVMLDGMPCTDDTFFCTGDELCLSGVCTSTGDPCPGICDEAADVCGSCGDGVVSGGLGEECDPGAPQSDNCCKLADCTWVAAGDPDPQAVCSLAGECEVNICLGGGTACGVDFAPPDTPCGSPSDTACDDPDSCDGIGHCQDNLEPITTLCRASAGDCDPAEYCDGASPTCPLDAREPDTTVCRISAGDCDPAEYCDGASATCPSDAREPDTVVCRGSAGVCDLIEYCDGVGVDCPLDAVRPSTVVCRGSAGDCDVVERCDGTGVDCPEDAFEPDTILCRASADICDLAEYCDGASADCPLDILAPDTALCRDAAGDCDVAEYCDGASAGCPPDEREPNTTACRPLAGDCDIVEYCDGLDVDCPPDAKEPNTTVCRSVAGVCDLVEHCDGLGADCPLDGFVLAGVECRPVAGVCDASEACPGDGPDCPPDGYLESVECRASTDPFCDPAESCDGMSADCPPDSFEPFGSLCDDGLFCTASDLCNGAGVCLGTGDPCLDGQFCNEELGVCEDCMCPGVDPSAELEIDDVDGCLYYLGWHLDSGDEALNRFLVRSSCYRIFEIQATFHAFGPANHGLYSAHVYADSFGMPGEELGASTVEDASGEWPNRYAFVLVDPVVLMQGDRFWVGLRSEEDQSSYLPLYDDNLVSPHQAGLLFDSSESAYKPVSDSYGPAGNVGIWGVRVEGCALGAMLALADHTPISMSESSLSMLQVELLNDGFADTHATRGLLVSEHPEISVLAGSADFGVIPMGGSAWGLPGYSVNVALGAYGVYELIHDSSDGTGGWRHAFPLYVQGTGCSTENSVRITHSASSPRFYIPEAGDELGNIFEVDSVTFSLLSVEVWFWRSGNQNDKDFRLKVYSQSSGQPDLLYTGDWVTVSGPADADIIEVFDLSPPLTFRSGNIFWATVESQQDLSPANVQFGVSGDDGDTGAGSLQNGIRYDLSEDFWQRADYDPEISLLVRPHGCEVADLRYQSHASIPADIHPGDPVDLNVTIDNAGQVDASSVWAVLSSSDPDVVVDVDRADFGTVPAHGSADSLAPYHLTVDTAADELQYMLDLDITDGTYHWVDRLPLRLSGAFVDLSVTDFTTWVEGGSFWEDIYIHFKVVNQGNVDCLRTFQVDVYLDLPSPPLPGQTSENFSERVDGLGAGQSLTYDLVGSGRKGETYRSYVQVDTLQEVPESDEDNNVAGPSILSW